MSRRKLYKARHKISGLEQNGLALPTLQPNKDYELDPDVAREHVESGALIPVEDGEVSEPIPQDFPHYEDLIVEKDGTPTFETLEDLRRATDEELQSKDGIGPKSTEDIRKALKKYK